MPKLTPYPAITLQEVINRAFRGLMKQECGSVAPSGACYYTHPDNHNIHCAIGWALPSEWVDKGLIPEGRGIESLMEHVPEVAAYFSLCPGEALYQLQYAHDRAAMATKYPDWPTIFERLHTEHGLPMPEVEAS